MLVEIDRKLAENVLSAELAREIAEDMSLDLAALRTSGEISNDAFLEAGVIQGGIAVLANMMHSGVNQQEIICLLYTSPSPRDRTRSRMPSSA